MRLIDVHTHLDGLEVSVDEAIASAREVGLERLITVGTNPADLPLIFEMSKKYFPVISCTFGIHPHEAAAWNGEIRDWIAERASQKEVLAIGEIGLDYYYKNSAKEVQKKAFIEQIELALDLNLPIEIHTRDAEEDTIEILKRYPKIRGIFHCFSGTQYLADEALKLGFNLSISGIVTFKNAKDLRDIVEKVPFDRLHVETDAPFLAPVPMRGKKNVPAYMVHTVQFISELKKIAPEKFAEALRENAQNVFPKLQWI